MTAGSSAETWAAAAGRLRWWQHIAAAVGVETPGMAQGRRLAARRRAGAEGERRTDQLLAPLTAEGWHVLPDRAVGKRANVDHVLVAPDARLYTLDTKLWSARYRVRLVGGRLMHGDHDRDRQVDTALWETGEVSKALGGMAVTPLVVVHNAPVEGGGFHIRGVAVFPADRLVELLRGNAGRPRLGEARRLAVLAAERLPSYVQ